MGGKSLLHDESDEIADWLDLVEVEWSVFCFDPETGGGATVEVESGSDVEVREAFGVGEDGAELVEGGGGAVADGPAVTAIGEDEGASGKAFGGESADLFTVLDEEGAGLEELAGEFGIGLEEFLAAFEAELGAVEDEKAGGEAAAEVFGATAFAVGDGESERLAFRGEESSVAACDAVEGLHGVTEVLVFLVGESSLIDDFEGDLAAIEEKEVDGALAAGASDGEGELGVLRHGAAGEAEREEEKEVARGDHCLDGTRAR